MDLSDSEWKERLTDEQFRVLRRRGTEKVGSGEYLHTDAPGVYACSGCGQVLFRAEQKRDSSGWPSFVGPAVASAVTTHATASGLGSREVRCSRCDGHLGHVFDEGPGRQPRYCINSAALRHLPPGRDDLTP